MKGVTARRLFEPSVSLRFTLHLSVAPCMWPWIHHLRFSSDPFRSPNAPLLVLCSHSTSLGRVEALKIKAFQACSPLFLSVSHHPCALTVASRLIIHCQATLGVLRQGLSSPVQCGEDVKQSTQQRPAAGLAAKGHVLLDLHLPTAVCQQASST